MLTEIVVPEPPAGLRATYLKFITRSSEDRPCVGVAATLRLDAAGVCEDLRVVVGAVAGTPQRFPEAEAVARGERPTAALFARIGDAYAHAVDPIDDARGSAWYRRRMVRVLVGRALGQLLVGDSATATRAAAGPPAASGRWPRGKLRSPKAAGRPLEMTMVLQQQEPGTSGPLVGQSLPYLDAVERVTGTVPYTLNLELPGMLHVEAAAQPARPRAHLARSTPAPREALPGVVCRADRRPACASCRSSAHYGVGGAATSRSWPSTRCATWATSWRRSRPSTRTPRAAALDLIEVEYEELPAVFDAERGAAAGRPAPARGAAAASARPSPTSS